MSDTSFATNEAVIIDVRSPAEYAGGHVNGATNLPLDRFVEGYQQLLTDKSLPVVIYCASGARSGQAVQFLMAQGYMAVTNGISAMAVAQRFGKSIVA